MPRSNLKANQSLAFLSALLACAKASPHIDPVEMKVEVGPQDGLDQEAAQALLSDNVDENTDREDGRSRIFQGLNTHLTIAWALNLSLLAILIFNNVHMKASICAHAEGSTSRASDFGPARHLVDTQEVLFQGGPARDQNGSFYLPHPSEIRYVGEPDEAMDKAWEDLVGSKCSPFMLMISQIVDGRRKILPHHSRGGSRDLARRLSSCMVSAQGRLYCRTRYASHPPLPCKSRS